MFGERWRACNTLFLAEAMDFKLFTSESSFVVYLTAITHTKITINSDDRLFHK